MKYILIALTCLSLGSAGCKKDNNGPACESVTVTQIGTICDNWGIKVGSNVYPSSNIPDQFKQEGRSVCAEYTVYQDMRLCACCGGEWADIKSMRFFTR